LRDYAAEGQLGLEKTPEEYVARMVELFREVRRVLRKDGTLWLNLGDSYATQPAGNFGKDMPKPADGGAYRENKPKMDWARTGLKPKDLCGIPWRVAFALQADGWWLRSDIIWAKPNPMPESVTDRPTKSHEYLFLLTKSANYFYDAEAIKEPAINAGRVVGYDGSQKNCETIGDPRFATRITSDRTVGDGRNKRTVWTVATSPYSEAHFATFPPDLIKPCIMAGTSAKGCCAKCGAPWERVVEREFQSDGKSAKRGTSRDVNDHRDTFGDDHGTWKTETLGWQPTCLHYLTCDEQRLSSKDATQRPGSGKSMATEMEQEAVGRPETPSGDSSDSKQASDQMSILWQDKKNSKGIGILQSDLLGEMDVGHGTRKLLHERCDEQIQVRDGERQNNPSTQISDGAASKPEASIMGSGASHQWRSERQSNREPGRTDNIQSRINAHEAAACNLNNTGENPPISRDADPALGIVPCTVLDPFGGSGTTGMVALELGRKAILIELNENYCKLIEQRCNVTPGLALA